MPSRLHTESHKICLCFPFPLNTSCTSCQGKLHFGKGDIYILPLRLRKQNRCCQWVKILWQLGIFQFLQTHLQRSKTNEGEISRMYKKVSFGTFLSCESVQETIAVQKCCQTVVNDDFCSTFAFWLHISPNTDIDK